MAKKKIEKQSRKKTIMDELLPRSKPGKTEFLKLYNLSREDIKKIKKEDEKNPFEPFDTSFSTLDKWAGVKGLMELYDFHVNGDKGAVLLALWVCFYYTLPIPQWVENAFVDAYDKVKFDYEEDTWDQVFGKPHPKNTKKDAQKNLREKGLKVFLRVEAIKKREPKTALDRGFFHNIGMKTFGISGSLAEKYYYHYKKLLPYKKKYPAGTVYRAGRNTPAKRFAKELMEPDAVKRIEVQD
ncbi:MAG: hypothetical protein JW812_01245 [Alphaproteobacteria bacterium]|nr:hypothetical protein [Alphaproteobacteria bacterium]